MRDPYFCAIKQARISPFANKIANKSNPEGDIPAAPTQISGFNKVLDLNVTENLLFGQQYCPVHPFLIFVLQI